MKFSPIRKAAVLTVTAVVTSIFPASAAPLTTAADISRVFAQIALSPYLAEPSMILIDRSTGEVLFQQDESSPRRPASILKILSAATALEFLDPNKKYVTRLSMAVAPKTLILQGELDPWMTGSYAAAKTDGRAWLPYLANKAIVEFAARGEASLKEITVKQVGLYSGDISYLRGYFKKKGILAKFSAIKANEIAAATERAIATITSPSVSEMVKFALTWSDNLLAERLARAAARATGFTNDEVGVAKAIKKMLTTLEISDAGLYVYDGSGLSKSDRVTVRLIADLLLKIRDNPKFAAVYDGLPVAGISGTLENRYLKTAPQAVGLVRAKTGTLNGTVSLAGYVESGTREYIFVAIADRIKKGSLAANRARATLDKLLGRITAPFTLLTQQPQSPSASPSPEGGMEIDGLTPVVSETGATTG
ncbi:MAG: D-alanyl-D-alanine carboxypeptidase [Actinobacteria bacterium]|nr:D-alanyl-D-alanine carboxypeptidase [Actinomycetota bacterium]